MNTKAVCVLLVVPCLLALLAVDRANAQSGGGPPVVGVTTPIDEDTVPAGPLVAFSATAVDLPDHDLGSSLVWTSSLDGVLGHGRSIARALRPGIHRITAEVTAPDGRTGSTTVIVTAVPPLLEIAPDADTSVDESRPSTALGTSVVLDVDSAPVRQSLLRFTVTGVGTAQIERAVLRLTVASKRGAGGRTGGTVRLLEAEDWTEEGTTYETRPPVGGPAVAEAGRVRPGRVFDFDVTAAVRTNGVISFVLTGMGSDGVRYRSREASRGKPRLVLTLDSGAGSRSTPTLGAEGIRTLAAVPDGVGYEDFSFGSGVDENENRVTGAKPESKLWWHDGFWWATLWQPQAAAYRIHWLDPGPQTWVDSGILVDERPKSRQDVLLQGERLYVVSRFAGSPAQNRLLRYTYSTGSRSWILDAGFPVSIPGGGTESMTIARESGGTLWVAFTLNAQVFVSHTTGSDTSWSSPFVVPVSEGTTVDGDDIAAVQALPGKIGVFWGNQSTEKFYFATHTNGASPTAASSWQLEVAAAGGNVADDHMNLKLANDGRLFVAVKTSKTASADTLVGLLVRSPSGAWSPLHAVNTVAFNPTRPICVIDESRQRVSVFYSADHASIRYKESDFNTIAFPAGAGTPFIESDSVNDVNNPTTSKQNVGAATGLVVLASSPGRKTYWHNSVAAAPPSTTTSTTTTTTRPPTTTTGASTTTSTSTTSSTSTTTSTTTTRAPTTTSSTTTQPPTTTSSTTTRPPTTTTRLPTSTTTTQAPTTTTTTLPRCTIILGIPICL